MKIRFRRALSLVCTISLLLTCMPVNVLSEEVVVASDIAPDLYDAYPFLVDEEEFAEFEDEEPAASAEETPEELSVPAEETPEELPAPAEEAPVEPAAQQEGPAQQPAPAQKASAETVESETETMKNSDVETAVAEQETTEEPSEEQPAETSEETAAESAENTPAEADITITDEAWTDDVIIVPENAEEADLSVSAELEEGKEYVVRVASDAEANLCFLLTSDAALEAAFTTEEHENLQEFAIDVTENPNDSEETGTAGIRYTLTGIRFEQGSSGLIRIVAAAPAAFTLQVLTSARWLLENSGQAVEEAEEIVVEKQDEATAENQETGSVAEEAAAPEEEIPAEIPAFEIEEDTLVRYNGTDEDVTVPDGIREIGPQAFLGNETIKTVTLPDSVELINNAAFADCVNLEQVIRSEQSLLITIGNGAFRNDAKLDISFAENVPNVLSNAFEDAGITEEEAEETEEEPGQESEEDPGLVYEGEDFTVTVRFGEEAGIPEGTELTVREILPETEEYEAYFNLTDEERAAIWNAVAEQGRLFLIAFLCNEEEIAPLAPVEIEVRFNTDEVEEEPEETEEEPEIVYAESPMVYEDEDFTVTVNFGDDAGFLQGTELRVREILPGTAEYALYSGQTEDVLNENWDTTAEFARFFDITFIQKEKVEAEGSEEGTDEQYIEKKIEPQAPIDVQMTFADVIPVATEAEEELQVQAIHFDEEQGAQVIESEAQSVEEVAVSDETVVDTVAFSSDSFSVYGFVQTAKITESVISADGHTYKIEVTYGQDSEIPVNAELAVEEILPGTAQYDTLLQQALKAAKEAKAEEAGETEAVEETTEENETITVADDQYARFFDIEIQVDGEKKEPSANVSVSISLADAPEVAADELAVVHFAEEGTQVLETKTEEDTEGIQFETDSFSVYGVIVVPPDQPQGENDLDGRTFTISYNGHYITTEAAPGVGSGNPNQLKSTQESNQATIWQFESAGEDGKYYISTIVGGDKQYLNLERRDSTSAHGKVSGSQQSFTVTLDNDKYILSAVADKNDTSTLYYLRQRWVNSTNDVSTSGFSGMTTLFNESKLTLGFTEETLQSNGQYILLTKYEGNYYVIHNDGTLVKVDNPDTVVGQFKIDDPMVWQYTGENLYHHAKESGFTGQNLASDYYYRYIDADADNGLTEEDVNSTTGHSENGYRIDSRPLMDQIKIDYSSNRISSKSDPSNYIGIIRGSDGKLRIAGKQSSENAAEIYFVKMTKENSMTYNDQHHTVNHIDISIVGNAAISVPLAYGTYYYKDDNGNVQKLIVTRENQITVDLTQEVDIEKDDVKKANIIAYTVGDDGAHNIVDNAFYISGYSGNNANGVSNNQTRIEGVFKVADLPEINTYDNNQYVGYPTGNGGGGFTDNNGKWNEWIWGKSNIEVERLKHKIYYSISTTKEITFDLKYNNHRLYETAAEANADDGEDDTEHPGVKQGTTTVTLSATFDYWDLRNECPPLGPGWGDNRTNWVNGAIIYGAYLDGSDGSGMDFALGTIDKEQYGILAIEITKYIIDEAGNLITPMDNVNNVFHIYRKADPTVSEVAAVRGMDVNDYHDGEPSYSGYTLVHDKKTTVGEGGSGSVYDYNIGAGMIYIQEDKTDKNLPKTIEDTNGKKWNYVGTEIRTEYVWCGDGIEDSFHVSKKYTTDDSAYNSHPEVLGNYKDVNGIDRYNGFLEYYVYNIYKEEPIDVSVKKVWKHENGSYAEAPSGASINVELGRFKLVQDTENPVTGSLTISHTVDGKNNNPTGTYYATYKLKNRNKTVRSFSYDPSKSTQTLSNLPAGNYTLEITESINGFTSSTTIDNQTTNTKEVSISVGNTTNISVHTTLTYHAPAETVTVKVNNYLSSYTAVAYQHKEYVFPAGETIVFTIYRPGKAYRNAGFSAVYKVNNGNETNFPWPTEGSDDEWIYVNQNWEYQLPVTSTEITIDFIHNWNQSEFFINSVALKNASTSQQNEDEDSVSETENEQNETISLTEDSEPTAVSPTTTSDGMPVSEIPGMKYVDDVSFSQETTLSNGVWEDVFTDLDATDANGYKYLYYIRSVSEQGVSNETTVVIETDSEGNILTSRGETELVVTNTVPNEKPIVTLKKVDDNGQPLTGAKFRLTMEGTGSAEIIIENTDGTYEMKGLSGDGLDDGTYVIDEIQAPTGYNPGGNIRFTVSGKAITSEEHTSGISFDGRNYTFIIPNAPVVNDGSLKIIKKWQDIYGNVLSSHPNTASIKLIQLAKNEGPQHTITVRFYERGNREGADPNQNPNLKPYNNNETKFIAERTASGWGTATIEWNWNKYTSISIHDPVTISGIDSQYVIRDQENYIYYEGGKEYTSKHNTLTFLDNGAGEDIVITVTVDNGNWIAIQDDSIGEIHFNPTTKPGGGYTLTGGEKVITLSDSNSWAQEYAYNGDGVLSNGSTQLPATYNGRPCRYVIAEESIPEGYSVSYSNNNTSGEGYLDNGGSGVLTAYNRKISTNVTLIKVDKDNRKIKLEGAKFTVFRINPARTGIVYMDDAFTPQTTNEDGEATFRDLPIGYYEIQETQAPTNYQITGDGCFYIKVTTSRISCIEKDLTKRPDKWRVRPNDILIMVNRGNTITVGNEPKTGALKITKFVTVNGIAPSTTNGKLTDGTYIFSITGKVGTFTESEEHKLSITFANGRATKYRIDNNVEKTVTGTDNSWSVVIPGLKIGEYTIKETNSGKLTLTSVTGGNGDGNTATADVTATVINNDGTPTSATAQVTFTNNTDRQIVKLRKYADEVGTNRTDLAGAEFQIYTLKEYTTVNPPQPLTYESPELSSVAASYFKADKTTMVSKNDGNFYVGDIACGDYVIVETKAPDGYLARTPVLMQVTKDQNDNKNLKYRDIVENDTYQTDTWDDRKEADSNGYYNLFIENTRIPITVTVEKVDANNSNIKLNGSTFKLYSSTDFTNANLVKTYENTNTSTFTIATDDSEISPLLASVAKGDTLILYLVETVAPAGYNLPSTYYTIVITKGTAGYTMTINGDPVELTINNDSTRYDASLSIPNTPGVELPATGGSGTLWYNIMGLALILLAGGLLMVNRRRAARERG